MSSLILELQQELLNKDCNVLIALRKAHAIAVKLKLVEFDKWIVNELNGYSDTDNLPSYRIVYGTLKAFNPYKGWIPVLLPNNEIETKLQTNYLKDPISGIMELIKSTKESISFSLSSELQNSLGNLVNSPIQMEYAIIASSHQLKSVIEQVINTLLTWTLKLEEEGICGEGLTFSIQEQETAIQLPQTVNNYYGNIIQGDINNSQIINGDEYNINYQQVFRDLLEIEESIKQEGMKNSDEEYSLKILQDIKNKIEKKEKGNIIKKALKTLKDFLIEIGASMSVALLQAKFTQLL